jgi:Cysteine rich repeat
VNTSYSPPVMTAILSLIFSLATATAHTQDIEKTAQAKLAAAAAKMESTCGDEVKKFCSTVTPGEGRMVFCLMAHEDKLSPACTIEMHQAAMNVQMLAGLLKDATTLCRGDLGKVCGQTQAGHGRLIQCLMTNKAKVSNECADAVQKLVDFAGG